MAVHWQVLDHLCVSSVHQHSDCSWWFMDEFGEREYGPFISHAGARIAFNSYVDELNRDVTDEWDGRPE